MGVIFVLKNLFENTFDFNNDCIKDNFEKRAEYTAFLNEIRIQEGIKTDLSDMSAEQLADLSIKSGIDPSDFGF